MQVLESFTVLGFEVKLSLGFRMVYTELCSMVTELLVRARICLQVAHFTFLRVGNGGQRRLDRISIVGSNRN